MPASRQQEQGSRARDTTKCVTRCKNGEKCKVCVFRCYGTQSRARRKHQENSQQQVKSARASPLACSLIASQPRSFSYSPKMARNAKCTFYGTRSRAASSRRNTDRQVGSARASPLACHSVESRALTCTFKKSNLSARSLLS